MDECNRYCKALQQRRWDIVQRIEGLCQRVLGVHKTAECQLIFEKIAALNEVDQVNPIQIGKMSSVI